MSGAGINYVFSLLHRTHLSFIGRVGGVREGSMFTYHSTFWRSAFSFPYLGR